MRSYLIVDDNRAFAENLAEIIADAGDRAELAADGEHALALARQTRFDCMICDMRMPVMTGAQVVHRVRRIDPGLPAIVVTAYTGDDDLQAARDEGLLAVLPKPVPVERLLEHLRAARRDGLVALVEDDPAMAENLAEVLRMSGFQAVTARSITETERLGAVQPFCALVDLRVPGGPDGAAMNLLHHRFPSLPMLIVSAHRDIEPPLPHHGRFDKPFETRSLIAAVEQLYAQARHA